MTKTPFKDIYSLKETASGFETFIPDDWLQGRSTYGGLTAALCLEAALLSQENLPPLKSAQVTFIGPAAGAVKLSTRILRSGKNVTYIESEMHGETGIAAKCLFSFGTNRESQQVRDDLPMLIDQAPEDVEPLFPPKLGPVFTQHFEQRLAKGARPISGANDVDLHVWARLHDWKERNDIVSLIAVADALPPSEMAAFKMPAPISSMTWHLNILSDGVQTADGWWLLRAKAEHTRNGYSSQDMYGWNRNGEPVFAARQSIAIFI